MEKMGLEEIGREMRILKDHKVCTIFVSQIPSACACAYAYPQQHKCLGQACFTRHSSLGRDGAFTPRNNVNHDQRYRP